ncbi:MAG: hypothetical protein AAGL24_04690 [Pseudomonadota bacterium]
MPFGRRNANAHAVVPPHPGSDPDGVTRVIPKDMWNRDDPTGAFLRTMSEKFGLSPDGPSNVVPTQDQVQARFDQLKASQEKFIANVNAQLPGETTIMPWTLIPWAVWNEHHTNFLLITCELYPVGPWNIMLLPADERSALVLELPRHPGVYPDGLMEGALQIVGELHEEFRTAHATTAAEAMKGNTACFGEFEERRKMTVAKVCGLAHFLGTKTFGEDAMSRHEKLFGRMLGWPSRRPSEEATQAPS